MNPILRNILAVIVGLIAGSAVNMGIITIGGNLISPPEGADVTTMEGMEKSIHLFEAKHFIMPFLAHALGTFFGALLAGIIAASYKITFAFVIGCFFLIGGIMMAFMLPAPLSFEVLDLTVAYIPMALLAGRLSKRKK